MKIEYLPSDGYYRPSIWITLRHSAIAIFFGWGQGWPRVIRLNHD